MATKSPPAVLIYILRHDLRLSDNPIFHHLACHKDHGFSHLLPVYVFPAQQIEITGFLKDDSAASPYPEARGSVSKVWRTGPHRAKFITQSVWNLKESLEAVGSGLLLRVGKPSDVVQSMVDGFGRKDGQRVGAVWMTSEEGVEERRDQTAIAALCKKHGLGFKLFDDEKYYVDDRDVSTPIKDIPDVFTTYRKSIEPLRTRPRATLPKPEKGQLPPFPDDSQIPAQLAPFSIPTKYDEVEKAVLAPVRDFLPGMPPYPEGAESAHPFSGGETSAHERLRYLIKEGLMYSYKETRNGLLGPAFSTKLSAFLSQGCITARQIHHELVRYEDGTDPEYEHAKGFKEGENEGTTAVRFELLWRDYMRLCTKKFRHRLFSQDGFRDQEYANGNSASNSPGANSDSKKIKWKSPYKDQALADQTPSAEEIEKIIDRFNSGTTGMGLIDASQRELLHTGYTSNRARQNVASFLTKHLGIDWRFGAEWYEMLLVDYDVSSNWANWQYVAGVGNDPRGEARIFNPVKQAFDYDKDGAYVKTWVPEVQPLDKLENVFQVATTSPEDLEKAGNGLAENVMVTDPVKRIEFLVDGKPKTNKRPYHRARGPRRPSGYDGGARQLHTNGNGNVDRGSPSFRGRGGGGRRGGSGFYGGRGRGGTGIGMPGAFPGMYNHVAQGYFAGPPTAVQPMGGARGYHHGQHPMAARGGYQSAYPNPYVAGPPPPTG